MDANSRALVLTIRILGTLIFGILTVVSFVWGLWSFANGSFLNGILGFVLGVMLFSVTVKYGLGRGGTQLTAGVLARRERRTAKSR